MITNIPFEIARDIAYFELHKKLTALTEKDPSGSAASKMEAMKNLREYENRSKVIYDYGLETEELETILEDFKTNPISLKSCTTREKQTYMIAEMESLLSGNYDKDGYITRLIKAYGYNDAQAQKLQEAIIDDIKSSGKIVLSLFDKANEYCTELAVK